MLPRVLGFDSPGSPMSGWSLDDFRGERHGKIIVAIPSLGREVLLVDQSLSTLKRYNFPLQDVYIFIDPRARRSDGQSEIQCYRKFLRSRGMAAVHILPGAKGLMQQYNTIFKHFRGKRILVMSDTVSGFQWRKHLTNTTLHDLPEDMLRPLVHCGFAVSESQGAAAWSLGPCKNPMSMSPGHISRKCGLLDGNFFGLDQRHRGAPAITVSGVTTDVEFSLRMWQRHHSSVRFLGFAAIHEYQQPGGHRFIREGEPRNHVAYFACRQLAALFPELLRFEESWDGWGHSLPISFRPVGPEPLILTNSSTNRGRRPQSGRRARTDCERQRACRAAAQTSKKKIVPRLPARRANTVRKATVEKNRASFVVVLARASSVVECQVSLRCDCFGVMSSGMA